MNEIRKLGTKRFDQWMTIVDVFYKVVRIEVAIIPGERKGTQSLAVMWVERKANFWEGIILRVKLAKLLGAYYFGKLPKKAALLVRFTTDKAGVDLRREYLPLLGTKNAPEMSEVFWVFTRSSPTYAWNELGRLAETRKVPPKTAASQLEFEVLEGWSPEAKV